LNKENAMNAAPRSPARTQRLVLTAATAADLMTANPHSIRQTAAVRDAIAFLVDRGYSAAPVIDEAGRPVGVLSRADIVVHDREQTAHALPEYYHHSELALAAGEPLPRGFQVEAVDRTTVQEIMTPVVFGVPPDAAPFRVIEEMRSLKVHRLFVVSADGVLVGVISALDVLAHLRPET